MIDNVSFQGKKWQQNISTFSHIYVPICMVSEVLNMGCEEAEVRTLGEPLDLHDSLHSKVEQMWK